MKITISMPDEVYNKLEEDRGLIPRSTYIQKIIKESGRRFKRRKTRTLELRARSLRLILRSSILICYNKKVWLRYNQWATGL